VARFLIEGGRPLTGEVTPSGNKNEALPALMACLLTEEAVTLRRMPRIGDVLTVCEILEGLGAQVEWTDDETVTVEAKTLTTHKADGELCARIRASLMLLGPMLARMGKVDLTLPGGDVIGARRIDTHWEGIEALGGTLHLQDGIYGEASQLKGTEIFMDEPSVTATENLVMMASLCEGTTVLHNAACEPHVAGLCRLLQQMGADIQGIGTNRLEIHGQATLRGGEHTIGADFMEVGSFICLGAIGGGAITIRDACPDDLRFPLKVFSRLGIQPSIEGTTIKVDGTRSLQMEKDIGGRVATISSGPWPGFPTDLMSVSIVAATQAEGTMIFFEKMFEGRMFFTDKLMSMGANIVLCDPHRVVINGPSPLRGMHMSSPDVRAGMALLMAATIAHGTSEIDNIYQIERGYQNVDQKLAALGAAIKRLDP
jgi:UDP-N-acetylglucosamine 1-carboxyvinyltransferase